MSSLDLEELKRINQTKRESSRRFNFGETQYISRGVIQIPAIVKGRRFTLATEILQGDVPWLIGKVAMGKMGMHIDVRRKMVRIEDFGNMKVRLREDENGHLRMTMRNIKGEQILLVGWKGKNHRKIRKDAEKLHLQFGHGSGVKIFEKSF